MSLFKRKPRNNRPENLIEVEEEFVQFLSEHTGEDYNTVRNAYMRARQAADFSSKEFRDFGETLNELYNPYLHDRTESSYIIAYQNNAYLDTLRYLGYSYPKKKTLRGYVRTAYKLAKKGEFGILKWKFNNFRKPAGEKLTLENMIQGPVTILEYGAGPANDSYRLAKKFPGSKVVLVDIDSIATDFTEWRFKKHGIPVQSVRVTVGNEYPKLPPHDVCIAMNVMEHLHHPLKGFRNIDAALKPGGLLYGNFEDQPAELFHVSPNLQVLRGAIQKAGYENVAFDTYRKPR